MSGMDTVGTYMHWHLLYKNNSLDFRPIKNIYLLGLQIL